MTRTPRPGTPVTDTHPGPPECPGPGSPGRPAPAPVEEPEPGPAGPVLETGVSGRRRESRQTGVVPVTPREVLPSSPGPHPTPGRRRGRLGGRRQVKLLPARLKGHLLLEPDLDPLDSAKDQCVSYADQCLKLSVHASDVTDPTPTGSHLSRSLPPRIRPPGHLSTRGRDDICRRF